MKIKLLKKFTSNIRRFSKKNQKVYFLNFLVFLNLLSLFFTACSSQSDRLYQEAYSEIEKGHFRIAIDLLEKAAVSEKDVKKQTKAYVEAARIARFEIQDFDRAIRINRQIILKAAEAKQRFTAQSTVAEIYLENIQNYNQALKEMLILEQLNIGAEEKEKLKFKIAQAQFLSGNSSAALEYLDNSLKTPISDKKVILKLKAQILVSLKKFDEALRCYDEIKKIDLDFFTRENLFILMSIVYEEKEDYATALSFLEKNQNSIKDKSYLELRIKRLRERLVNKPLFKGKRK